MSDEFTEAEAQTLIGKRFESLIQYGDLPRGTHGRVVALEQVGDQWKVVIEFETGKDSPHVQIPKRIMQQFWTALGQ